MSGGDRESVDRIWGVPTDWRIKRVTFVENWCWFWGYTVLIKHLGALKQGKDSGDFSATIFNLLLVIASLCCYLHLIGVGALKGLRGSKKKEQGVQSEASPQKLHSLVFQQLRDFLNLEPVLG